MATTRVKITETTSGHINPSKRKFEIDENGRLHGLQEDLGDGEYNLYVFLHNKNYRDLHKYESVVLKYFKSNKQDDVIFVSSDTLSATDKSGYIDPTTSPPSLLRPDDPGIWEDTSPPETMIRPELITEAEYYEMMLGGVIADQEESAVRRKYGLA